MRADENAVTDEIVDHCKRWVYGSDTRRIENLIGALARGFGPTLARVEDQQRRLDKRLQRIEDFIDGFRARENAAGK